MALLNFSLPFHSANFAPEPFFNIPPSIPSISPPPPLPSAAEINSLYSPPSHQQQPQRRQAQHPPPRRSTTNHYRPSSAKAFSSASASVQSTSSYSRSQPSQRNSNNRHQQKGKSTTIPPPPPTPAPNFAEKGTGGKGSHTLHAVIDYDDYDEILTSDLPGHNDNGVTPIQGPILLKNGSVPVVPLYSYPVLNNGSFVQIPIMWTALSLALGLEIRGEIIRGVPCIKRFHQLFCPTAGNSYPIDRIERFIDENKALMKRMYGEFQMTPDYGAPPSRGPGPELYETKRRTVKREAGGGPGGTPASSPVQQSPPPGSGDSFFGSQARQARQSSSSTGSGGPSSSTSNNAPFRNNQSSESGRLDACESKVEIVTPYWASNSAGKIRAIVNTQHFEQAIHQEVCSKVQTKRCSGDCGCEQKYKWHRLLAYDPDNDCKGIFMDWFLFPSCCVCRCDPFDGK